MLLTSVKNNIKSILRDPTTILAFIAAVILCFIDGFDWYTGPDGSFIDTEIFLNKGIADGYARQTFFGFVNRPIHYLLFPFIAIVIALNLFKDKRTEMYDVLSASQMPFRTYYISRLLSYYIISVVLCMMMTFSYEICYIIIQIPPEAVFDWIPVLITQAVAMPVMYTSVVWIPIAWSVFFFSLTGNHIIGIVVNGIYRYIPLMINGFVYTVGYHYIHATTVGCLHLYVKDWIAYPETQRFALVHRLIGYGYPEGMYYTSFLDAIIAYLTQIVIAAVLFTVSYFLLKRRFQRA